jgi:hypothetical protein
MVSGQSTTRSSLLSSPPDAMGSSPLLTFEVFFSIIRPCSKLRPPRPRQLSTPDEEGTLGQDIHFIHNLLLKFGPRNLILSIHPTSRPLELFWALFQYRMNHSLVLLTRIRPLTLGPSVRFVSKLVILPNYILGDMIRIVNGNQTQGLRHIMSMLSLINNDSTN